MKRKKSLQIYQKKNLCHFLRRRGKKKIMIFSKKQKINLKSDWKKWNFNDDNMRKQMNKVKIKTKLND